MAVASLAIPCSPGSALPAGASPLDLQMVQHFTELDLRISSARISSDGGWFVDGEQGQRHSSKHTRSDRRVQCVACCTRSRRPPCWHEGREAGRQVAEHMAAAALLPRRLQHGM